MAQHEWPLQTRGQRPDMKRKIVVVGMVSPTPPFSNFAPELDCYMMLQGGCGLWKNMLLIMYMHNGFPEVRLTSIHVPFFDPCGCRLLAKCDNLGVHTHHVQELCDKPTVRRQDCQDCTLGHGRAGGVRSATTIELPGKPHHPHHILHRLAHQSCKHPKQGVSHVVGRASHCQVDHSCDAEIYINDSGPGFGPHHLSLVLCGRLPRRIFAICKPFLLFTLFYIHTWVATHTSSPSAHRIHEVSVPFLHRDIQRPCQCQPV